MANKCQGLNSLPREEARRIYEARLKAQRDKRLSQTPGLRPRNQNLSNWEVEGSLDWMDNLTSDGWNDIMGGPDFDGDI